jgi:hypothetical protein
MTPTASTVSEMDRHEFAVPPLVVYCPLNGIGITSASGDRTAGSVPTGPRERRRSR